jgi:hypothetical protein
MNIKKTFFPIFPAIVLSCLIWMYADQINSENLTEMVTLQVASPSTDMTVEMQEPISGQFQVTFTGPREQLERLKRDLGSGKFKPVYSVESKDAKSDLVVKDCAEILNTLVQSQYNAVSIIEAKPAQVKVFIDHMVWVEMPVQVYTGNTKTTPPVVKPNTVKVLISKAVNQELTDSERTIVVNIENDLLDKPEDKAIDEEIPLPQVILGQPVVTDPTRVEIKLGIQRQYNTKTIIIPQIQILGPIDLLTKYYVDIRDPQVTVSLKGPVELIKKLESKDVEAYLELQPEDVLTPYTTYFGRRVKFVLPDGIKLDLDKMARPPEVDFKLSEQQPAPSPMVPR